MAVNQPTVRDRSSSPVRPWPSRLTSTGSSRPRQRLTATARPVSSTSLTPPYMAAGTVDSSGTVTSAGRLTVIERTVAAVSTAGSTGRSPSVRARVGQGGPPEAGLVRVVRRGGREGAERRPDLVQRDRPAGAQVGPGAGQVTGDDPPGDAVDDQVVDDQQQLAAVPGGAQHDAGGRVEPGHLGGLVERAGREQAGGPQAGGGHVQGAVEARPQQVVPVEQRLQDRLELRAGQRRPGCARPSTGRSCPAASPTSRSRRASG